MINSLFTQDVLIILAIYRTFCLTRHFVYNYVNVLLNFRDPSTGVRTINVSQHDHQQKENLNMQGTPENMLLKYLDEGTMRKRVANDV